MAFLAVCLAFAAFAFRPAPLLGMDGEALQHSVGGFLGGNQCEGAGDGVWRCSRQDGGLFRDETTFYRVEVDRLGCWTGQRASFSGEGPQRISGCVSIVDFIFG